ncbi:spore coat protein U domain-containing protein [Hydrogenophaga sp.]|uniref:spore coat protein U domain-containing protein n=1 Tax=Hydrogenophaga sp. TaxID=1904254 RepID=UPI003F6D373C
MTVSRPLGRAWLCLLAWLAWAPTPSFANGVQCAISSIDVYFEPINPVEGAPQHGQGELSVVCINPSAEHQQVALVAFDPAPAERPLRHAQEKQSVIQLELFHDAAKRHPLGRSAHARFALRAQHWIAAETETTVKLPFHARLTVGPNAPAGAYRREMTMSLVYQ